MAWLAWALAAAASVQLAPSPVYVALVIGVAALVVEVHSLDSPFARAFPTLVGVGVLFAVLRVILTAATTHGGAGSVLFTAPEVTLPEVLGGFTVGGTVELQVVLQSAVEGFAIVGIMAVFGAFNATVAHYELVQAAPRAFHELGLVVVVALAFVPSTIGAIHSVREADRARTGGRVIRRGRLLRLVVPILESGMERAIALAESMDSRGFARGDASGREIAAGWCGLAGLLALGGAFVALVGGAESVAVVAALGGAGVLVAAVATASAGTRRVRYRPRPMTGRDWGLVAASALAPVVLVALDLAGDDSLRWTVSVPLRWPAFNALPAAALALLLGPMLPFWRRTRAPEARARRQDEMERDKVPA